MSTNRGKKGTRISRSKSQTSNQKAVQDVGGSDLSDKDRRLRVLLEQARSAVLRVRERELAPVGVTAAEASVLYVLDNASAPVTPSIISRWIRREPHATSKLLQRMERKGLVLKNKDLNPSNFVRVSMTDKGRKAYEYSMKEQSVRRLMSPFSEREKQQLDSLLTKLLRASQDELLEKPDVPYA